MFGVDSTELLVVAVFALLFIGPKDLPRVMLSIGRWVGKVRGYARHFTAGVEQVIRDAELEEMERTWREHNATIMAQHPAAATYPEPMMTPLAAPADPQRPAEPQPTAYDPDQPSLPLEAPAAPDDDPRPASERPLP